MTNKGINPLYVSALDVLIGTLGVFIVLNFLHSRLLQAQAQIPQSQLASQLKKPEPVAPAKPVATKPANGNNGSWWQRTFGSTKPQPPETNHSQQDPTPASTPQQTPNQPPSPPQDPVAVDLMKQTQGAVVILLQQTDVAKNSVELMLRQGSRTWKPSRASKYQDDTFAYQKGLNYFYQPELHPGTFEVLVRIRRGSKAAAQQPFALYGKIVPPGQRTQTYAFGRYGIAGSQGDWVPAGQLVVTATGLEYRSHLSPVAEMSPTQPTADPGSGPAPVSAPPAVKPKRSGKWG